MVNINSKRNLEILVVDDNQADNRLIHETFKDESFIPHNLFIVNDGTEAMKYLHKEEPYLNSVKPDIILLDLYMPKKSGREVLYEIKSDNKLSDIAICIMSATSEEAENIIENTDYTGVFYILKPVDTEDFMNVLIKAREYLPEDLGLIKSC